MRYFLPSSSFHPSTSFLQKEEELERVREPDRMEDRPDRMRHRQRHGIPSQSSPPEEPSPTGSASHPTGKCSRLEEVK